MGLNGNPVTVPCAPIPELPRSGEWKRNLPTALGLAPGKRQEVGGPRARVHQPEYRPRPEDTTVL